MIHEMNLFRLAQNICPTLTLKNYVEFDENKKDYVKNDLILYPLEYFKEDRDSIEFSTYSFIDCDYIHEIKVVFPAYYAHSGWVKAGELTKTYKVAYLGQKLETNWSASQEKSACITYYFKKIESYGYAHWDFNEDDNVKKYFKDLKETNIKYKQMEEIVKLENTLLFNGIKIKNDDGTYKELEEVLKNIANNWHLLPDEIKNIITITEE